MFILSCRVNEPSKAHLHEVFSYAADQSARSKSLTVIRRMGVKVVATNLPSLLRWSRSCSNLDLLRHKDKVTVLRSVFFDDLLEG